MGGERFFIGGVGAISGDAIRVAFLTRQHSGPAKLIVASLVARVFGAFALLLAAVRVLPILSLRGPGLPMADILPDLYAVPAGIMIFWVIAYVGSHHRTRKATLIWLLMSACAETVFFAVFGLRILPLIFLLGIGATGVCLTLLAAMTGFRLPTSHWSIRGLFCHG